MGMKDYNGQSLGPLMPEDALLLQAVIKMTTPKVLVELGHFWGESARKIIEVMGDAHLYSYDNTKDSSIDDPRFTFYKKSQEEVDVPNIDFIFIDASHDIELNKQTFIKLLPLLTDEAIIAVHDTGTWCKGNVFEIEYGHDSPNGYVHCPDELKFVDWIKENYPDFQQIHFHSSREVRHGMTLLQKYTKLT